MNNTIYSYYLLNNPAFLHFLYFFCQYHTKTESGFFLFPTLFVTFHYLSLIFIQAIDATNDKPIAIAHTIT